MIDVTAGPVGGKGLEEGEDVLLRAFEGAVELDAGIAVVGVEPGEKVEVVGVAGEGRDPHLARVLEHG